MRILGIVPVIASVGFGLIESYRVEPGQRANAAIRR